METEYPKFERRKDEGVSLLIRNLDEYGDLQTIRYYFSEKTIARLKRELNSAINNTVT